MGESSERVSWPLEPLKALAARLARTDLQPSPAVNALFRQLVELCLSIEVKDLTDEVRALCGSIGALGAVGETNLERHWARAVVEEPSVLERFPFLHAYRQLVSEELAAVRRQLSVMARRWTFVGAGPLPLSPLLLERELANAEVTYVDVDSEALRWGQQVAAAVNGARPRRFVNLVAEAVDYSNCDVVVIAALAGRTVREKGEILKAIERSSKASVLVLVRSVPEDGRELLYPRVDEIPEPWRVLEETEVPPGIINSTLVVSLG